MRRKIQKTSKRYCKDSRCSYPRIHWNMYIPLSEKIDFEKSLFHNLNTNKMNVVRNSSFMPLFSCIKVVGHYSDFIKSVNKKMRKVK